MTLCAALAGLALVAASASAKVHPFKEVFGSAAQPSLIEPIGIAVDQSSGDVLVMSFNAGVPIISRFHPDGTPASFSALGTNVIDGKGTGVGDDKTPQEGLEFGGPAYSQIAVDNSGTVTDGDIYVTQPTRHVISVFSREGEYLGQLTGSTEGSFSEACGVTVDPSGAVYVGDYTGGIHKFVPSANPPVNADNTANFFSATTPCTLAAGAGPSAGFLFAASYRGEVAKLGSTTGAFEGTVTGGETTTVSVDPETGDVYVAQGSEVSDYDASGSSPSLASLPIQLDGKALGVGVDGDSGDVYVEGSGTIDVYGPAVFVPPLITEEGAEGVVFTEAKVRAKVRPNGLPTTYHFEYGTDSSYGKSTPEKPAGSGEADHDASALLEGLSPGTTYHWRIVATNSTGTTAGPDRTFTTYSAVTPDTDCSNQEFRVGPSALLPDCRAYEMVSPVDKGGGDIIGLCNAECRRDELNQASVDGGKLTFSSFKAFGDATSGRYTKQYMATRGPEGWSTHSIAPPYVAGIEDDPANLTELEFSAFTPDLSQSWLVDTSKVPQTPDGVPGYFNLYHISSDGSLTALTRYEPKNSYKSYGLQLEGYSKDGEAAIYVAGGELLPNSTGGQLYDFVDDELHLVSVQPSGQATGNANAGSAAGRGLNEKALHGEISLSHAISDDGSRIFWSVNANGAEEVERGLYVRLNPTQPQSVVNGAGECTEAAKACTLAVSEGEAWFWTATPDGSKALFTEVKEAGGLGGDLYTFNVDTATKTLIAHKTLGVAGASEDLSHIYFVSEEALAPGGTEGERNLYLDDEGALTYIAAVNSLDTRDFNVGTPSVTNGRPVGRATRVTANGRYLAFMSTNRLTGYDNADASNGKASAEVYLYDSGAERLICVSCNPSGARPHGAEIEPPYSFPGFVVPFNAPEMWAAAWLNTTGNSFNIPNALSEDGSRLFFNSYDALLPRDTNGAQDVYEWEAPGTGSCTTQSSEYSPENEGCISLISTGQSPQKSEFVDATPDGSEVFFKTSASIDPRDPGLIDIYDAHVEGGFPPPPPPPTPCLGDACQGVPAAPSDQTPSSASFRGAGDLAPRKARGCKARKHHAAKGKHRKAKRKAAKSCRHANRRAGR